MEWNLCVTRIGGNQCNRKTEIVRNSGSQVLNTDIKQGGLKTTIQSENRKWHSAIR